MVMSSPEASGEKSKREAQKDSMKEKCSNQNLTFYLNLLSIFVVFKSKSVQRSLYDVPVDCNLIVFYS